MIWIQATRREGDLEFIDGSNKKNQFLVLWGQLCHNGERKQCSGVGGADNLGKQRVIGEDYYRISMYCHGAYSKARNPKKQENLLNRA